MVFAKRLPLLLLSLVFAVVFSAGVGLSRAEFRTWTAADGRTVEAEMVSKTETSVKMRLRSGLVTEFPLDKLSAEDQRFVKGDPLLGAWGSAKTKFEFFDNGRLLLSTPAQTLHMDWSRMADGNVRVQQCIGITGRVDVFSEKIAGETLTLKLVRIEPPIGPVVDVTHILERGHAGPVRPDPKDADLWSAQLHMSMMQEQMEKYKKANGDYPTTEQGIQALAVKPEKPPIPAKWTKLMFPHGDIDPWGNKYRYRSPAEAHPAQGYEIWSIGPDGKSGTPDDIWIW